MTSEINIKLNSGEEIVWRGSPNKVLFIFRYFLILFGFSLILFSPFYISSLSFTNENLFQDLIIFYLVIFIVSVLIPLTYLYFSYNKINYIVTNQRIFLKTGPLFLSEEQINISDIDSIYTERNILDTIFRNTGDILFDTGVFFRGENGVELFFTKFLNIDNALEISKLIFETIQKTQKKS